MTAELVVRVHDLPPIDAKPRGYVDQERLGDVERALRMFAALGLSESADDLAMVTIPGAPWSKSRPRFTKSGRTYPAPGEVDAEKRTGDYLRRVVKEPFTGNVGMACLFFRPNRQRIDADNLIKHVCDAANGVLWADDSQCTAVMGIVELDAERPRTVVVVGQHASTMTRGTDATYPCSQCGEPIGRTGQSNMRKTCSKACAAKARGYVPLDDPIPCAHCSTPFRRGTYAQKLCSPECRAKFLSGKRKARGNKSRCSVCSKKLAHTRGGKCRDCWKAGPDATLEQAALDFGGGE